MINQKHLLVNAHFKSILSNKNSVIFSTGGKIKILINVHV